MISVSGLSSKAMSALNPMGLFVLLVSLVAVFAVLKFGKSFISKIPVVNYVYKIVPVL